MPKRANPAKTKFLGATTIYADRNQLGITQPFSYESAVKHYASWVYAAATANAIGCASVPLRLYVGESSSATFSLRPTSRRVCAYLRGEDEARPSAAITRKARDSAELREVESTHPLLQILEHANPVYNGYELAVLRHVSIQLTGNAYLFPVVNGTTDVPDELWLMFAQWTTAIPATPESGELVAGYRYGRDSAVRVFLTPAEVIHFRAPNPRNLYYGMGRVEAAWNAIQQNVNEHLSDLALLENRSRPDWFVVLKNYLDEAELKNFEARMAASFRGPKRSGRMLAISGDVDLKALGFPPKDVTGRDDVVEEIAAVFGVPIAKLKANDPNRASAEQADYGWLKDTILPMLRQDEETLNERLVPLFDLPDSAFLAYDNPVPEQHTFQLDRRTRYVAGGIITVNEARNEQGLDPLEGGDVLRVNGVPFDRLGQQPSFLFSVPSPPTAKARHRTQSKAVLQSHYRWNHKHAGSLGPAPPWYEQLASFWHKQSLDLLAELGQTKALTGDEARQLRQFANGMQRRLMLDIDALEKLLNRPIADGIEEGGHAAVRKLGLAINFDQSDPRVLAFLDQYIPRLARTITAERAKTIAQAVREAVAEGESMYGAKRMIEDSPAFSADGIRNRAELIARTETARAAMQGTIEGWDQSGVIKGKQWRLAPDACEFCQSIADQFEDAVIPLRDSFMPRGTSLEGVEGGNMLLDYEDISAPPLHPNCACDLQPIME